MRSKFLSTAVAGCSLLLSSYCGLANAALVVSLTGTIEDGDLNGISIDGQSFEIGAVLVDGMDTNGIPEVGFFALNSARLTLGNGNVFDFDPVTTVYAQAYRFTDDDFAIGFRVPTSDGSNPATIGYVDRDQNNLPFDFDPSAFQAFSYSAFDSPFSSAGESQIFESGSNVLRIDALGMAGASATAVPEPGLASLLGAMAVGLCVFRSRERGR